VARVTKRQSKRLSFLFVPASANRRAVAEKKIIFFSASDFTGKTAARRINVSRRGK
jgi:hypothetical protein